MAVATTGGSISVASDGMTASERHDSNRMDGVCLWPQVGASEWVGKK